MLKKSRLRLPPKAYKLLCYEIHERDGWKCVLCKRREGLAAHHIVFRSQHGDDASWNLLTLCTSCHDALHGTTSKGGFIITAKSGKLEDPVNADEGYKFIFINGWTPKGKKK